MRPRIERKLPTVTPRPVRRAPPQVQRHEIAARPSAPTQHADAIPFAPDPYVDYGRYLTPEGGILFIYKDIDERWRFIVRGMCLWAGTTGFTAWFFLHHSPVHSLAFNIAALVAAAIVNWLIVGQPVEVYRTIEIRPDCMILEARDVFWLRYMESWPSFGPGEDNTHVLTGTYGTRNVEFLKVRAFDEFDSTPTVLAAHLQQAMQQLWGWPY